MASSAIVDLDGVKSQKLMAEPIGCPGSLVVLSEPLINGFAQWSFDVSVVLEGTYGGRSGPETTGMRHARVCARGSWLPVVSQTTSASDAAA